MKQTKKEYNKRAVVLVQPSYSELAKETVKFLSIILVSFFIINFARITKIHSICYGRVFLHFLTTTYSYAFRHLFHLLSFIKVLCKDNLTLLLYQMGFGVLELHDWLNYRFRHELKKLDTIVRALYQSAVFRVRHNYPITLGSNCYFSDNLKRSFI